MAKTTEISTELEQTQEATGEVQASALSAAAMREIEVRVMLAKRFPRDEEQCYQRLMKAMKFPKMAERARYKLPWLTDDDGKPISGPSVHLARVVASIYGNMVSGNMIVAADEDAVTVRGMAWDLESNYTRIEDVQVNRWIPRKGQGLVRSNQDQMMRNCANYGGRKERNCLLRMFRQDIIDDALAAARETQLAGIKADPTAALKKMLTAFGEIKVSAEQLQQYLGHKVADCSAEEIGTLREIFIAIRDGEARWSDYVKPVENGTIKPEDLKPSEDPNRGHDQAVPKPEPKPEKPLTAAESEAILTKLGMGSEAPMPKDQPQGAGQKDLTWG